MVNCKKLEELVSYYDAKGTLFVETDDSYLVGLLEEEITNAGLDDKQIVLLLPELNYRHKLYSSIAEVEKIEKNSYEIRLFPVCMEEDECSARIAIRHELAHIKYGDVDRWWFSEFLEEWYSLFVEEPRAIRYEECLNE